MSVDKAEAAVAVLIVNYNSGDMLGRALDALARQTFREFRVVVVDNGSSDGSMDRIRPQADVEVVRAGTNLGFAAGNNLALKHAGNVKWIALLNPDAFPEPDWLERMLAAARAAPRYSFFGCRMLLADKPEYLDGTGDIFHVSGLTWRRDHGAEVSKGVRVADEIFAPCAAAALYKRADLEDIGGFDERYFCYHEDVDLAFRLRLRGHRCLYVPDAVVRHVSSGIVGRRSDFAAYHGHRNLVWTYVKNMPTPLLWLCLPAHLLMNVAAVAALGMRGQFRVLLKAKRDAIAGLEEVLRQRRAVQARRVVSAWSLLKLMQFGWQRR